ncbi:albumin-like [Trichosurus vulpecula]|uniref:albumin-like n=1 Tax=Trichosurus vulpecula TaxID=9337 RepID=UPI00186AEF1F|nr:albumin-like [Trichosurus vulpecula]
MKWVTFISLLFLFSSAHSREIFRRDAPKSEIAKHYRDLGEDNLNALMLITFAQYLQKCPYEHHKQLVAEVTAVCAADETVENCDKSLHKIFGDKSCTMENFREMYGEMADCCAKAEPERNHCFLSHKDDHPDLPKIVKPEPESLCQAVQENEKRVMGQYLYEVARRHPYFYAPTLLVYAHKYKDTVNECCQSADKASCLNEKLSALQEKVVGEGAKQRFVCSTLEKFGERTFKAGIVGVLSQKFPKIEFADLHKLVDGLAKTHAECCHGDLLECADDRVALSDYICNNKDAISSKLGKCCDKPVLEKSQCIIDLENDDIPANLPNLLAEYVETKDACQNYKEAKDVYLATYLYDVARRHPELATSTLLRVAKQYENTLEECCVTADPPACYAKVTEQQKAIVDESNQLVKERCDVFEKVGEYFFENIALVNYAKKVPQLSTPTLLGLAHDFGKISAKCCKLSDQEKTACAEDYAGLVFDKLCRQHEKTPVSERVTKCCTDSLANRRTCFTALGDDDTYQPKPFSAETFTFHADLCTLPEEEKQKKKQSILVEVVKHKPRITDDQIKGVITDFRAFVEKCCKDANQEACFAADGPKLVASVQAALA